MILCSNHKNDTTSEVALLSNITRFHFVKNCCFCPHFGGFMMATFMEKTAGSCWKGSTPTVTSSSSFMMLS